MGVFLTVSRFHMHEVPVEERRGCQTPGNWSYIKLELYQLEGSLMFK